MVSKVELEQEAIDLQVRLGDFLGQFPLVAAAISRISVDIDDRQIGDEKFIVKLFSLALRRTQMDKIISGGLPISHHDRDVDYEIIR